MNPILEDVRSSLLEEARLSPHLLSDLAGLEQYIAESYNSRSFAELLQNADDAGASRFVIQREGQYLLVANDGRIFTRADFESLCRSAASNKERGTSIGFRGIGFKSVVGLANTIHLFSGELAATFSRERTAREIPQAKRVPLIRIPHPIDKSECAPFAGALNNLQREGLSTIFVFGDLIASGIESEFAAFDPTSLLFLRHVRQVELRTNVEEVITVRREIVDERIQKVRLATSAATRWWTIVSEGNVNLAFAHDDSGICRLDEQEAVVHAFLPTHEPTGLAIKINGDLSTDPSRTRVVLDNWTQVVIDRAAQLIVKILLENLMGDEMLPKSKDFIRALVPTSDPRVYAFQRRSFKTELLAAIKKAAQAEIRKLVCRPSWLNAADFEQIASASGIRTVPRRLENIDGLLGFLRYLGATDATLDDLLPAFTRVSPSVQGCAEIVARLITLSTTKAIPLSYIKHDWKIWPVEGSVVSLHEAISLAKPFDQRFVDMVVERTSKQELRRFVEEITDAAIANVLMPELPQMTSSTTLQFPRSLNVTSPVSSQSLIEPRFLQKPITLKRWRSAEQQVMALLTELGWQVSDVSRQNVGYDIEGLSPEGQKYFFEVKSINYPNEPFILTSNEEAVAREKCDAYVIALVHQSKETIEIAFIRDPANHLKLIRQCRQWVWECSEYDFHPEIIAACQ
jgi:hypothetical protein